jgi:hypothetical protein
MKCLRRVSPEIKCHVRILSIVWGITLLAVDKVGELYGIFYEENWGIISYHIVVAFLCEVLNRKTSRITITIIRTALTCDCWESEEDGSLLANLIHELCFAETKNRDTSLIKFTYCLTSWVISQTPWAAAPFAWTTRSGILSRAKWASLSRRLKSWTRIGPLGPAVREFWLSATGWP